MVAPVIARVPLSVTAPPAVTLKLAALNAFRSKAVVSTIVTALPLSVAKVTVPAKALHASTRNGPVKDLEKLLQYLYKDNKDASSSFPDDLKNGAGPPTLIHDVPSGCIHYSTEAKKSILNKLLQHKDGSGRPIKDHLWEEVLDVAKHYTGNLNITKQKLK